MTASSWPGMTAKASLTLNSVSGIIVPLIAVGNGEDGQAYVFIVTDGKIHKRPVTVGMKDGGEVQVLSGLAAGDTIAVSNVAALQDGMEVAQ